MSGSSHVTVSGPPELVEALVGADAYGFAPEEPAPLDDDARAVGESQVLSASQHRERGRLRMWAA